MKNLNNYIQEKLIIGKNIGKKYLNFTEFINKLNEYVKINIDDLSFIKNYYNYSNQDLQKLKYIDITNIHEENLFYENNIKKTLESYSDLNTFLSHYSIKYNDKYIIGHYYNTKYDGSSLDTYRIVIIDKKLLDHPIHIGLIKIFQITNK